MTFEVDANFPAEFVQNIEGLSYSILITLTTAKQAKSLKTCFVNKISTIVKKWSV